MADYSSLSQHFPKVRIPTANDLVYKEECAYSFDTPECEDGLFVSLTSFLAFNKHYALVNYEKTKQPLYLNIKRRLRPKAQGEVEEPPKKKPNILAIGVEGGFEEKAPEYDEEFTLVELPSFKTYPITPDLPDLIYRSITEIRKAREASKQEDTAAWIATEEPRPVSKHAVDLKQIDNGVKIPPSGWQCSLCDKTENLWLNLTDGTILCGRRYFDGSGGNNHAVEYFQKTGHPLVVKLGTITSHGAEVYSYAEDTMVEDPKLEEHLAHWGINMHEMQKTEKTIAELEVDINYSFDWARIEEKGKTLTPLYGPGYTGLKNLGNSCYLNSVVQSLFAIPEFQARFSDTQRIFQQAGENPNDNLAAQLAKIADGLLSGKYSLPKEDGSEPNGIPPRTFKSLIGKGHPEFSTMRQQDALEFFQHLLTLLERDSVLKNDQQNDLSRLFKFEVEEKVRCMASGKVKLSRRQDTVLMLDIPLDQATNKAEVDAKIKEIESQPGSKEAKPRYRINFASCLDSFSSPEEIAGFYSSAIQGKTTAIKTAGLRTFPKYLVIALRRFTIGENWAPKKLDVLVDVPDELDLENLRSKGLAPGEEELPEDTKGAPASGPRIDEGIVASLLEMGFPVERARKAAVKTNNAGAEAAMNWLFEHMEDPDIDAPLETGGAPAAAGSDVPEESIAMLVSMGFSEAQARKGLKATDNNVERAMDWIFSHPESAMEIDTPAPASGGAPAEVDDAPGRYRLFGLISHIGASTHSGHYVCHLKKNGSWAIFNDEKVSASKEPPKDLAYLYLFERV